MVPLAFPSIYTVSCGNGKACPVAPPLERDQEVLVHVPPAPTRYSVRGVVNVIPVFPSMSPRLVPVQEAAPAPVTSLKSAFCKETAAAVIVNGDPTVCAKMLILFTFEVPLAVKVPVTV